MNFALIISLHAHHAYGMRSRPALQALWWGASADFIYCHSMSAQKKQQQLYLLRAGPC